MAEYLPMEPLFRWEVTSVVVPLLVAVGFGVLALNDFELAKIFFLLSAADGMGGAAMGISKSGLTSLGANVAAFVGCGLIGLVLVGSFRYVDRKETESRKRDTPAPTAVAPPPPKSSAEDPEEPLPVRPSPKFQKPKSPELAPAGFISFVGQVINGMAPMMQENQTDMPLDDVFVMVTGIIPNSESPRSYNEWGTGKLFWEKQIEVGTVRARLTTGIGKQGERFAIPPEQSHLCFLIFMETRFQTYQEQIYLTKISDMEFEARLDFGLPEKATYSRTQRLAIAPL